MESALENAAKRGNRDMVKLLLDTCATRNLNDSTLRCTVAEAAKNAISCGDVEVAKLLLGEYDGSGAGQVKSARKGKLGVLSTLLELSDHETVLDALFKIASPENVEMSKLMLEKCDDSVFAQIFGHAAEHGFVALVQRLLDRVDPCTVNRALVRAAVRGHAEVVQALLGRCDETNIDFALEVAAWVGHADVVVMLRDRCDPGSVKNALANATAMEVVHLLSNKKARTA
ncbi:hypothetical protein PF005_g4472 [Phytophthora fragariae]|uniref:Uncharacterized protein n=2 Tax=Phytophthora fragariae TaxID=53985 RepID=A0A6A3J1L7_9STRA|nr:hypothetical protein PF009_g17044 [Phytophthora fragariae]KAE8986445.1 hypothetical protein PF011_g19987 [Phytophthora fragariae]KAE9085162.1 hypothetical protein PF007_g21246 [Phytophthora fragariae]KAE9111363.1 hypothetical protein PF006_g20235 [Phytophthora fragariae]KAE9228028.1 hypothetical protein PF005_g4472 [Phytophthora fragariae]